MKKLLSLIILLLLIFIPSFAFAEEYIFDVKVTGTCNYSAAYEILELTNEHRKQNGLSELTMDKNLLNFAMQRAAEIAVNYDHMRPNNQKWYTGYPYKYQNGDPNGAKYENIAIAQNSAYSAFTAWKNSSGHNKAMLASDVKSIGIGAFYQPDMGKWTWVQVFSKYQYSHYSTSGTATKTFTIPASSELINIIIYTPELSYLASNSLSSADEICPAGSAEYGLAVYNGIYCAKLDPSCYTLHSDSGNINISGNTVTGITEGEYTIRFDFAGGITLTSNPMTVTHSYDTYGGTVNKEPTCTEDGYTSSPCTRCGHIKEGNILPALGHTNQAIPEKPATCTQDGLSMGIQCSVCGEVQIKQQVISATGHDWMQYTPDNALAGATYYTCKNNCGESYVNDPYGQLNDEILEIYERGVTEDDRQRLELLQTTYYALSPALRERLTNFYLIEMMFLQLDGMKGDINGDGYINAVDATQILRYANGKTNIITNAQGSELQKLLYVADVNDDGVINAVDATQILRYANGKTSVFDKLL